MNKVKNTASRITRSAGEAAAKGGRAARKAVSKTVETIKNTSAAGAEKMHQTISEADMSQMLDTCYDKALTGIPMVSKSVDELAQDYLKRYKDPSKAAKALANNQVVKCTTSGFITGLGGLITLPVAVPANVGSVLYVQMRMIAAIAEIGGFDPASDQVQTLVYACLTGTAIEDILKNTGIKFGQKLATSSINKISGATLTKINQKVGFRFITKFGETGIINLGKMVPVAGGVIGGGFDLAATRVIANNALVLFIGKSADDKSHGADDDNTVIMPESSGRYLGRNYLEVSEEMQDLGFSSVICSESRDTGRLPDFRKKESVVRISIGGHIDFKRNDRFDRSSTVRISYKN